MKSRFSTAAPAALLLIAAAGFAIGMFAASCGSSGVVCLPGLSRCGLGCADFAKDVHNCGACSVSCETHQVCQTGQCQCEPGTISCNGSCVVPSADPQNCGGCGEPDGGSRCLTTQVCETGQCRSQCSVPGLRPCSRSCVDVLFNPQNCGDCTVTCQGATPYCDTGHCQAQCTSPRVACGGLCVNTASDRNNCGACGNACDNARSCHNGICAYDVIAACFNTGQVVGIQNGTDLVGPLASVGSNPQALGVDQGVVLVADGIDRQLRQIKATDLLPLPNTNNLGASPNHILVDDPFVYIVNSIGNTLQILQRSGGDGGYATGLQLAPISELNFGPSTSPQAIVKVGSDLYIPLYGGFDGQGAGVVHVDVTNPGAPVRRETINFDAVNLMSFDGGTTYPRPSGIAAYQGQLYVALSNLSPTYSPGGPGIVAKINRDAGTVTSAINLGDVCLNAFWVASAGDLLFISCSGQVRFDQPQPYPVEKSAVIGLNNLDQRVSSWSASCAGTPGCAPPSAGRFSTSGDRLYIGDNLSGRVFVLQIVGNRLVERRGYAPVNGGPPLAACPVNPTTQQAYVPDLVSVP